MAKELSFTLPARDFGKLAEALDRLECQWAGVPDGTLKMHACWHCVDPETLKCVHCGAGTKLICLDNDSVSAQDRANVALLLRLRQFFAAIDQPEPMFDRDEVENQIRDDDEDKNGCQAVRVILAPIAKMGDLPANLERKPNLPPFTFERHEVSPKTEHPVLTDQQMFGPSSVGGLFPPFSSEPAPLQGGLEEGCLCLSVARRASSIMELAEAKKPHPLCPIHGNLSLSQALDILDQPMTPGQQAIMKATDNLADAVLNHLPPRPIEQPAPAGTSTPVRSTPTLADWEMPQPNETERAFVDSRRVLDELLEDARATVQRVDGDQSSPLFGVSAAEVAAQDMNCPETWTPEQVAAAEKRFHDLHAQGAVIAGPWWNPTVIPSLANVEWETNPPPMTELLADHAQLRTMSVSAQRPDGSRSAIKGPGPVAPTPVEPPKPTFVRSFTRWLRGS